MNHMDGNSHILIFNVYPAGLVYILAVKLLSVLVLAYQNIRVSIFLMPMGSQKSKMKVLGTTTGTVITTVIVMRTMV